MKRLRAFLESSFMAKVLVPVIVIMVFLLAMTAWVVGRRITQQFATEAARALSASNEGFREWQRNRTRNLLLRFSDLRNEPRYKAAFQTGDVPTVRNQLVDLLNGADDSVKIVVYTTRREERIVPANRDPLIALAEFESASAAAAQQALQGEERVDTIQAGEKLYTVVSIPAFDSNNDICGALTFGLEFGGEAVAELSRFTRSEIVLLANDQVMVKTILISDAGTRFAHLFKDLSDKSEKPAVTFGVRNEVFDDRHYYCSGGRFSTLNSNSTLGYLLLYSYEDSWRSLLTTQQILLIVNGLGCLLGSLGVCYLVGKATQPLRELRDGVEAVGRGDFSRRLEVRHLDECGELAQVFNQMTENLTRSREQLESAHGALVETSRRAGMAEAATGVLHNVGNVLTSVNIASALMAESLKKSKATNLAKLVSMLREHESDLGHFLTHDPKGKQVPEYLETLSESLTREQEGTIQELAQLQKGLEHIKDIVKAQQSYSKVSGAAETIGVAELVDDALKMHSSTPSTVKVVKQVEPGLKVMVAKHKALQILVNLLRNARQACEESNAPVKLLTVRADRGNDCVRIGVTDTGVGIASENLEKIFCHGFTTKKDGHGFGLHSSAQAAKEMGGNLLVNSEGPGKGATFTLELPVTGQGKAV
jgi:signal transduction histidine kinase